MTDQPDLKARVEELERECAELTKALTGLTRGGSEFFNRRGDRFIADIPACIADVRARFQNAHQVAVNAVHDKKAAESRLALADRLAEAGRAFEPWSASYEGLPDSYQPGVARVSLAELRALSAALAAYEEGGGASVAESGGTASPKSDNHSHSEKGDL